MFGQISCHGGGVCARMHVCGGVKFLLSSAHMGISKTSHLSHKVWAQSGPRSIHFNQALRKQGKQISGILY